MTVEEALITLLGATAGLLLFFGLAQALDDRAPRRARRPDRSMRTERWADTSDVPAEPMEPGPAQPGPGERGRPQALGTVGSDGAGPATSTGAEAIAAADGAPGPLAALREPGRCELVPAALGPDAAPPDPAIAPHATALAESRADVVAALIAQQRFADARTLVHGAMNAGELPAEQGQALMEGVAAALRRDIQRLTFAAVKVQNDGVGAVADLDRAEALLASMPDGALPEGHRAAIARRIWRGHATLGFRRLRLAEFDGAADTLLRALRMKEVGRRAQRQVRDALVRTIEGMVDRRSQAMTEPISQEQRDVAARDIALIEQRIERASEEGVPPAELEVAVTKLRALSARLVETAAG